MQDALNSEAFRDFLNYPDAGLWTALLDQVARWVEHSIERAGDYDLENIWNAAGTALELHGTYGLTVRKLLLRNCSPGQRAALQRAADRLKAARNGAEQAYRARHERALREAEDNAAEVTRIRAYEARLREQEDRQRIADSGA